MANFNNFPVNYPFYQPQAIQPPQQNDRIWVQGESGAKSYLVAPNVSLTLWDSEKQTIYIKSADANGIPSMKILDYTIRNNENQPHLTPLDDKGKEYATKDELSALKDEIMNKLNEVTSV